MVTRWLRSRIDRSDRDSGAKSRRRGVRPGLEGLEARIVQATAALDPTFGQAGFAQDAAAVAVQGDGKIVAVGLGITAETSAVLAVRRYNADGSLDATFGTNGQTTLPVPASATSLSGPSNLIVTANGSIVVGATAATVGTATTSTTGVVAQLTPAGQLDPGFGTGGESVLPGSSDVLDALTLQADGRIVAAGIRTTAGTNGTMMDQLLATRLTAAGALDTTFNGTGSLAISVPGTTSFSVADPDAYTRLTQAKVAAASSGPIYLGVNLESINLRTDQIQGGVLARVTSGGTLDTTYGSSGTLTLNNVVANTIGGIAVQPDNKLVVAGTVNAVNGPFIGPNRYGTPFLIRDLPSGAVDPSFAGIPLAVNQAVPAGGFTSVAIGSDGQLTVGGFTTAVAGTTYQVPSYRPSQFLVERFAATGQVAAAFGLHGRMTFSFPTPAGATYSFLASNGVALTPTGKVLLQGSVYGTDASGAASYPSFLAQLLPTTVLDNPKGDYDNDGRDDVAAQLASLAEFAVRRSTGGDVVQAFGAAGLGQTIPMPGDYDGDGRTDLAAYLPAQGVFAYRPSSGGKDVVVAFGTPGTGPGETIPAPGDYDGDGKADIAVYLPASGSFAIRPSSGGPDRIIPFGLPGPGQSIPAPGDYDGSGRTEPAVYLPTLGEIAYRPTGGGKDVIVAFGTPGARASIPTPGDYDGDGRTDIAVYLPASGSFAVRASSINADEIIPFGVPGPGQSVPAPGDYDGSGRTELAVSIPTQGAFAYRPGSGAADVVQGFGAVGPGQTVPATSIPSAQPASVGGAGGGMIGAQAAARSAAVAIPLTDELVGGLISPTGSRKKAAARRD